MTNPSYEVKRVSDLADTPNLSAIVYSKKGGGKTGIGKSSKKKGGRTVNIGSAAKALKQLI